MNKRILHLAAPNILSNLSVPLLSSVDMALMGHMDQVYYLGAIAIGGMIFNFVYWGFGFLRMGTTGLTAQAFGNRNSEEIVAILARALLGAISVGLLLILFRVPIEELSFLIISASADVESNARLYFSIRIYAAPATLALFTLTGWFLGMQNAILPLLITLVTNALNIGFNIVFIKSYGMKADGVALGTVCANYCGLIFAIWLFNRKYGHLISNLKLKIILNWRQLRKFFVLNGDIFIRTLSLVFTFSFFIAKSAEAGEDILAVNSILINLWTIMSYGIDGFAFAAESLVGRFMGAGDKNKFQKSVKLSFYWGIGLGLIFTMLFALLSEHILAIFTNNIEILSLAMVFIIWTIIAPVINGFCYIWDGIFIGATAGGAMRNSSLFSAVFVFLPVYYISYPYFGNHGLWFALILFMLTRGISLSILFKHHILAKFNTT